MKISNLLILVILVFLISCSKNKTYFLESEIKSIHSEIPHFDISKNYKIGKYKIDYSQNNHLKIYYSSNSKFLNPKFDLLKKNNFYYDDYDLESKDSLNKNSRLFFSLNPKDSYKVIKENKPNKGEPPLPYSFKYFNDSIVFKKLENNITKMYVRDNNTGYLKSPEYYYTDDFKIVKIIETISETKVKYE